MTSAVDSLLSDLVAEVAASARLSAVSTERSDCAPPACLLQAQDVDSAGTQCAICLDDIHLSDLAAIKGCEHTYCVKCILQWATARQHAACPTCKMPIQSLLVHRDVDGELSDTPLDMTVGFLARSPWYVAWAEQRSQVAHLTRQSAAMRSFDAAEGMQTALALAQEEYAEEALYGYFEDEYDELEDDYYMAGSGHSRRVVFGNRRFGEGGYISSGRRHAQPVQQTPPPRKGKGSNKQRQSAASGSGSAHNAPRKGQPGSTGNGGGRSSNARPQDMPKEGRRAARKAKRAAADGSGW